MMLEQKNLLLGRWLEMGVCLSVAARTEPRPPGRDVAHNYGLGFDEVAEDFVEDAAVAVVEDFDGGVDAAGGDEVDF